MKRFSFSLRNHRSYLLAASGVVMLVTVASSKASIPDEPRICTAYFAVRGNTILRGEINQKVKVFEDKLESQLRNGCLTVDEVLDIGQKLSQEITRLYFENQYFTSRAKLDGIRNGSVQIRIIEGKLADINVENKSELRLRESYILKRIRRGSAGILNLSDLENHLKLLRIDPLVEHIEASLRPSGQVGKTDLGVRVREAEPFIAGLGWDNDSPASIGSERFGIVFGHRNLTGSGTQLMGSYYRSTTGGAQMLDLSFLQPINSMNGSLLVRGTRYKTRITQSEFEAFDFEGDKDLIELHYRQPLVRDYRREFAVSVGLTFQAGQTFIFENIGIPFGIGPDRDGRSQTSVFKFRQEYLRRGSATFWYLGSQLSFGTDLFDATRNRDPIPDGRFFSWSGESQLGWRISDDHTMTMQASLQLTPDSLLASEQFLIGGRTSVRGYRQSARTGDNGFRFSLEDRMAVLRNKAGEPYLQIAPFVDTGRTWNVSDNPNPQQGQRLLIGAGLALLWNFGQWWSPSRDLVARIDYGYPFVDLRDKGSNIQDRGLYFSVSYQPKKLAELLRRELF